LKFKYFEIQLFYVTAYDIELLHIVAYWYDKCWNSRL